MLSPALSCRCRISGARGAVRRRFSSICLHYYPALILWTLLSIIAPSWIMGLARHQSPLEVLQAFVTHLLFVHTLSANTFFAIVPALWWLGLLAQFYFVFPWLLRAFDRLGAGRGDVRRHRR